MWLPVIEFFKVRPKPRPVPVLSRPLSVVLDAVVIPEPPPPAPKTTLEVSEHFAVDTKAYAESGDRDAILAASGMGKSYLAGVLCEEMLDVGTTLVIIDPEGENYTLAQDYPFTILGGDHATSDLDLDTATDGELEETLETVLEDGESLIVDLSGRKKTQQQTLFTRIVGRLFLLQERAESPRPIKLICEEARVFAPQRATALPSVDGDTCLSVFEDIAARGRKRGVHFLLATQRPASINKDVLSQCNRFWFGGMQSEQDCKAIKPFLQEANITVEDVRGLERGEFYFYSQGTTRRITVRKRKTRHGGTTPKQ